MGEAKRRANVAVREAVEALAVDTVGGRVQVRWNTHRAATALGQLAFFVEYLNLTGCIDAGKKRVRCNTPGHMVRALKTSSAYGFYPC